VKWTKRSILILAALAVAPALGGQAAAGQNAAGDRAAVEAAVRDYLEALYDVEPAKIERSVHRDLVKRGFFHVGSGEYGEGIMTYDELYRLAAQWNADGQVDTVRAPREIRILDLLDQTATARLEAHWGIDYLHLARYDGKWMIVQVLWQEHPQGSHPADETAPPIGGADARGPTLDPALEAVRTRIEEMVLEEGVPSVVVAVARDGVVLWEEGFGWADRERRLPATPHTRYSLASVTKPLTATAIMMLAEQGRLDLDAPIERYLGGTRLRGLAGDTREVTARRALAHSAGLPSHFRVFYEGDQVPSPQETLGRYGLVVFPPGTQWAYSNIGYRALDLAIANVAGRSYGDFLRSEIFEPLGMTRSSLYLDRVQAREAARRYDGEGNAIAPYVTDHPGSGDVWASAHDLLRFGMFHAGTSLPGQRPVLRPESVALMQRNPPGAPGGMTVGPGWALRDDRGHRLVEHTGGQPGVSAALSLYPDEKLAIVVLSNQGGVDVGGIARQIGAALIPEALPGWSPEDSREPELPPLPDLTGRWTGTLTTYEGEEPFMLDFRTTGDIHVRIGTRMTSLLNHVGRLGDARTGWFYGLMNTSDFLPHPHNLSLMVRLDGDELIGQVTAHSVQPPRSASSFVRLKRDPETSEPASLPSAALYDSIHPGRSAGHARGARTARGVRLVSRDAPLAGAGACASPYRG
jgi:CubicO group peptidase (beta-lactamase class C family)